MREFLNEGYLVAAGAVQEDSIDLKIVQNEKRGESEDGKMLDYGRRRQREDTDGKGDGDGEGNVWRWWETEIDI